MAVYRSDQAQLTFAVEAAPGGYPELASTATDTTVGVPATLTHNGPQTGSSGIDVGTHIYRVTWTVDGLESAGGAPSAVLTIANTSTMFTTLANIAIYSGSGTATNRKVYRTKADTTQPFYLLTTLSDNSTTGYADSTTDATLGLIMTSTNQINLSTGLVAGSRTVTVDNNTNFTVGDFIRIGPMWGTDVSLTAATELRRVDFKDGTTGLLIDVPTAFFHPDNTVVQVVTSVTDADTDKYIVVVPGVYETVDVPDPDMTIEARYFLGTQSKRNFFQAYKGQQTYTGSVPGFIVLDGKSLRFPIGKVVTTPSAFLTSNVALLNGATKKGDIFITYDGTNASTISSSTPHNILCIDDGSTTLSEVRKVIATYSSGTIAKLDHPLQFAHVDNVSIARVDTAGYYTHDILETVDLDTVSWHLHMRDSSETAANDFDRRYYGGMIGGASLSADEGGMLTMSWDGVNFQGMVHNQKLGDAGAVGGTVPFYTKMQSIAASNIQFPSTDPYYFSQGSVTLYGQEIARVRSFNLAIANNEEPRYYIQRRTGRQRGPSEIREQRREYSLAVTLALPDSGIADTSTTARLFNELLWEGDYGTGEGTGMRGFNITLRFDRGTNDSIVIQIPDGGAAATGGNNQGAFIRTAPHAITGDNPLQVDADVLFRNLKITVVDSNYYYP